MASPEIRPNRQLRELLQEEQEPFILENYLLERGHSKKGSKSEPSKVLNKSTSCHLQKIKKGFLYPSKLIKSLCKKLVLVNKSFRIKNCDDKVSVQETSRNSKEATESESFSSASSTTVYNSCPETDKEEASTSLPHQDHALTVSGNSKSCNQRKDEAPTDRKLRRRHVKESKKHNSPTAFEKKSSKTKSKFPVSHLPFSVYSSTCSCEEPENTAKKQQQENPSAPKVLNPEKVTEDSIISASFLELLVCSTTSWFQVAELPEFVHYNTPSQLVKSKRALLQNQQLLFDCVRELIDNSGRRKEHSREVLGSEEIGTPICDKIREWGKQSANEKNINQLLNLDFRDSVDEWNDFEPQRREFAMTIGDDILEELGNQLVLDMLHPLVSEMLNQFAI